MGKFFASIGIEFPFILLWLAVLYAINRKGRKKRAQRVMWKMMAAGVACTVLVWPAYFLNPFTHMPVRGSFAYNSLVVGISEEFLKFLTFVVVARRLRSIREPHDGVIQGAAVGMGFTLAENIIYGYWYHPTLTLYRSWFIGFHALSGALWGFAWAAAVFHNTGERYRKAYLQAFLTVIVTAMLHGLNNAICETAVTYGGFLFGILLLEALLLVVSILAYRWMRERSAYHRFPYGQARAAIYYIRKGITLDSKSRILRRRLAIYQIAAGAYADAVRGIRHLARERPAPPELRVFLGVALMGANEQAEGERVLRAAVERLSPERLSALETELKKVIRNASLRRCVLSILGGPFRGLDDWAKRRERLRRWNEPRAVYPSPTSLP